MNEKNLSLVPHQCILSIKAVYDNLKTAEKKAIDFLLYNPEKISSMTVAEYAKQAGCSEATIVRCSKKIGYKGFPELKRDFSASSIKESSVEYGNISSSDSPDQILKKVFESSITALTDTLNILNYEEVVKAADCLIKADKIAFTGVGDAGIVASEAQQRFARVGKHTYYSPDPDTQLIYASQLKEGDVLLAISHSGRTKPVINTVKTARNKGAIIISITNFPVSVLTKKSDIVLQTAAFSQTEDGEVISKRLTSLCIIEGLFLSYFLANEKQFKPVMHQSDRIVKMNKYD